MDRNRLATLIESPEVQKKILRDYQGGFSLGLTRHPERKHELAIRVRIEADDLDRIPSEIVLDGEAVPILVTSSFKVPQPMDHGNASFVHLQQALGIVQEVAAQLFASDPRIRSVGVTRCGPGDFGFRAVRTGASITQPRPTEMSEIQGIALTYTEAPGEIEPLLLVPGSGFASPAAASKIPEVQRHRPLAAGLQIQSFDDDVRQGLPELDLMSVGSLGCFVQLADGRPAILSNNHVLAGENRGIRGHDRILQAGGPSFVAAELIAVLSEYVDLRFSPPGATLQAGTAILNEVDAGIAVLEPSISFSQAYLPSRQLTAPEATASARPGDRVFKIGRTTGLTFGEVTDIGTIVGPIPYGPGQCWFRRSIVIEGVDGTLFADKGDSGAVIMRPNGEVIGLLYAGNGRQIYACPINAVLQRLGCTLV